MPRLLHLALLFLTPLCVHAQSETDSLPTHSGAMILDLTGLHVTQRSAKPQGNEIGVRAHDSGHMELLAFLFLTPENKSQAAATCLTQDLAPVLKSGKLKQQLNPFHHDDTTHASALLTYPDGSQVLYRYFGIGDQCLVAQVYADKGAALDLPAAAALLDRQRYDPDYRPTLDDASRYQSVLGNAMLTGKTAPARAPGMLVGWSIPGGIPLPNQPGWVLQLLTVYNNAGRPVAQFHDEKTHVNSSFILFENLSGKPTSEGCRADVMEPIRKEQGELISNPTTGQFDDGHGGSFATASHLAKLPGSAHEHDVFAFAGNAKTCAEIHVSTISGTPDEDKNLAAALALFHPDLTYRPTCADYLPEASAFYKQSPITGAPFYDACLNTIPENTSDPGQIATRRLATDQIVIALGVTGKIGQSRAYAERAIKRDPDYPLNYYNLACADAEEGKVSDAKLHLRQAFDRRANTLKGETLPDPTKDDSILKLKKDKAFWDFVQSLPGS